MSEFGFRQIAESDFPTIRDIATKSFMVTYAGILEVAEIKSLIEESYSPLTLARFIDRVRTGEIYFDVATADDRVIGFCLISTGRPPAKRRLHQRFYHGLEATLHRLYIDLEYSGKGVGYGLLARGEAFMRRRGVVHYSCFVHQANEVGKRFYVRQGFRHVKSKDTPEDWCMEKSLAGRVVHACSMIVRAFIG